MAASLGRILFTVGPLCTGHINTLLSLAGSRHSHTLLLAFGTKTKLLHHSDVAYTAKGTIICCLCNHSTFLNGSWSAYATLLGGAWYGQLPSLTCNFNVPLKHPIHQNTSLNLLRMFCIIHQHAFCVPICLQWI